MSTADKLNKVLETKQAIKQAIIDKGGTVGDVFAEYPTAIQNIQGGGGSGKFVVPGWMRFGNSTVKEFPEDWDWSEWKNEGTLGSAFYACNNLIKAPKLSIHPAVVSHMFNGCGSLKSVDMSDWNTESIFAASGLFNGCRSLETLDLSNWDTSSLTQMNEMFDGCSSLKSINFGTFNTDKVTDYASAFYSCNLLRKLPEFNATNWKPSYVSEYNSPLFHCYSLRDFGGFLNLNKTFYANSANSLSYESIMNIINKLADGVSGQTLYLTQDCVNMLSDDDIAIATNKGWSISPARTITEPVVVTNLNQIPSTIYQITPRTYDFSQYSGSARIPCYSSIRYFEGDFSNSTNIASMFTGALSLKSAILANTSNITDMSGLFNECRDMEYLHIADTSNVTSMVYMFYGCKNIADNNVSEWDVGKVTDMQHMFNGCESFVNLDLSRWNAANVKNMQNMFTGCKQLESVNFGKCDLSSVESTYNMFYRCTSLKSVTMLGPINNEIITLDGMFGGITTTGTFYYNPAYDYSKIIEQLPATWTAVPLTE